MAYSPDACGMSAGCQVIGVTVWHGPSCETWTPVGPCRRCGRVHPTPSDASACPWEDSPTGDYFATKYDSARDEVVALLADEAEGYGMRDDTSGDVDAPAGWFALVSIPADVDLRDNEDDDRASNVARVYGVTPAEVAGVHIVTHNSQGFVSVESFDSPEVARAEFDCRAGRYAEWSDEDRDEDGDGVYVCPVQGHGYHTL